MSDVWRGEQTKYDLAGHVSSDGRVWRGRESDYDLAGTIDADGSVWRGERNAYDLVGQVDDEGRVWRGRQTNYDLVGEVDDEGRVWRGERSRSDLAGEVSPASRIAGAAGILLLLEPGGARSAARAVGASLAAAAAASVVEAVTEPPKRKPRMRVSDPGTAELERSMAELTRAAQALVDLTATHAEEGARLSATRLEDTTDRGTAWTAEALAHERAVVRELEAGIARLVSAAEAVYEARKEAPAAFAAPLQEALRTAAGELEGYRASLLQHRDLIGQLQSAVDQALPPKDDLLTRVLADGASVREAATQAKRVAEEIQSTLRGRTTASAAAAAEEDLRSAVANLAAAELALQEDLHEITMSRDLDGHRDDPVSNGTSELIETLRKQLSAAASLRRSLITVADRIAAVLRAGPGT